MISPISLAGIRILVLARGWCSVGMGVGVWHFPSWLRMRGHGSPWSSPSMSFSIGLKNGAQWVWYFYRHSYPWPCSSSIAGGGLGGQSSVGGSWRECGPSCLRRRALLGRMAELGECGMACLRSYPWPCSLGSGGCSCGEIRDHRSKDRRYIKGSGHLRQAVDCASTGGVC